MTITFDLTTGVAKLATATTIKVGADVPVRVIFTPAPGVVSALQLALGQNDDTAAVLAFTEDFTAENETTWTALLDAGDTRLATFMDGKTATAVVAELVAIVEGARLVTPNLSITVQPAIINGPDTAPGGPGIRITDGEDGHVYRLVSNNGVLGLEQVS